MTEENYIEPTIIVTLRFKAPRAGLVVRTREPSAELWEEVIMPLLNQTNKPMRFIDAFIAVLDSWNLRREDGTAVPATKAGLRSMNLRFVMAVLTAWINNGIVINDDPLVESATLVDEAEEDLDDGDPFEGRNLQTVDMDTFAPDMVGANT